MVNICISMGMIDFAIVREHVIEMMKGLAPALTYHCVDHTLDVVKQCERIALDEVINEKELFLLKIAALYHDTGFLYTYAEHEKRGCKIFLEDTDQFKFHEGEKQIILDLIMATKVPQRPKTLLQKIICDADLDYLGRHDFSEIAEKLKSEFLQYKIVPDEEEWHRLQVKFLQHHVYHTNSSRLLREAQKKINLAGII